MGVDQVSIEMIEANLNKYLYPLWNRLSSGSYFPPPVKEVLIPKGDGKFRALGIPTILDRVAQQVIRAILEPLIEPKFHESSFGYRPNKSAHQALENCRTNCFKYWYVIDLDIKGFFDNIDHSFMMKVLQRYTNEKSILLYSERWLKACVQKADGEIQQREKGTPQGGVISPLLANLYLHEVFDKWMLENFPKIKFERYADDIVIHASSAKQSEYLMLSIKNRLSLARLELSESKSKIVYCIRSKEGILDVNTYPNSFDFLGFTFMPRCSKDRNGKLFLGFKPAISKKKQKGIHEDLRKMAIQGWTEKSLLELAQTLNPKIRGWINYYGKFQISEMAQIFSKLNATLAKWAKNKFKTKSAKAGYFWMRRAFLQSPKLFAHWNAGFSYKCLS